MSSTAQNITQSHRNKRLKVQKRTCDVLKQWPQEETDRIQQWMNRLIIELMDAWLLSSKDACVWWANMPLTFDAKSRLNTAALRPVGYELFNNTRHYASTYIHWKREQKGVKSLNGLFSCITQRGRVIQRRKRDVGIYVVFLNATA